MIRRVRAALLRLIGLGTRQTDDARMSEEMRFHLDRLAERYIEEGFSPEEARRRAAIEFGGFMKHAEGARDTMRNRMLEDLARDVRYTLRGFRKNPVFAAVAILTLALGIGANTVTFGVVNAVLIQPLPYAAGRHMVAAFESRGAGNFENVSARDLEDWRRDNRTFAHLAGYAWGAANVTGGAEPLRVVGAQVTPDFLDAFGARLVAGQGFTPGTPSAVISEGYWKRAYGGRDLSGLSLTVFGRSYPVTGVVPASFDFPRGSDVWVSADLAADGSSRSAHNYHAVGDLKPGVSLADARGDIAAIAKRIATTYPASNSAIGGTAMDLQDMLTSSVKPTLLLMMVMVGLVLLIACLNIANLLLARGMARRREMAVRISLGARTGRLARQLLTESLLLGLIGSACGVGLAIMSERVVRAAPVVAAMPVAPNMTHPGVFAFAILVALAASALFGVVPALQTVRSHASHGSLRTRSGGTRIRGIVLAGEVAVAAILLAGALVTTRSLLRLQGEPLGFDPQGLVLLDAGTGSAVAPQLLDRVRALPGVTSAALTSVVPVSGAGGAYGILIDGEPLPVTADAAMKSAACRAVSDGFFRTLGIPVAQGREFEPSDRGGAGVAVVNQTMAKQYWPGRDPLGIRIAVPGFSSATYAAMQQGHQLWFTVIGVVADTRDVALGLPPKPTMYLAASQHAVNNLIVIARSTLTVDQLRAPLLAIGRELSPAAPSRVGTLDATIARSTTAPRFQAAVIGLFAALALVLAAVGIYGVAAYITSERTAEIGVRIALGAQRWQVVHGVVRRVATHAILGLMAGLSIAIALSRLMRSVLYQMPATDTTSFGAVVIAIILITGAAAYLPARRAAGIDPMAALRTE